MTKRDPKPATPATIKKEMSVPEFQAWLEGFNEAIHGSPNKAQWERIKDKIALIRPDKEIQHVYRDWYSGWYERPYTYQPIITYTDTTCRGLGTVNNLTSHTVSSTSEAYGAALSTQNCLLTSTPTDASWYQASKLAGNEEAKYLTEDDVE